MVQGRKTGRKPGYKHDKETKCKISQTKSGQTFTADHKEKIRQALKGSSKSEATRDAMADSHYDIDLKCMRRFLEMRSEYPGCEDFFDSNKAKLLWAMRDIKSEKELRDIRKYIETTSLEDVPQFYLQYQYDSSSIYAQEEAMVLLVDAASFLRKTLRTKDENALLH